MLDSTRKTTVEDVTSLPFDRINAFIVELYQAAREIPAIRFKEWVFERLQTLIAFDSGIWIHGTMEYGPQVHGQYLYRQPIEMMLNYDRIKNDDFLAQKIVENPGTTWDAYAIIPREEFIRLPVYREHCHPYGMEATLATCQSDSETRLLTFVSIYRANPDHLFSETDRATKELLVPHLVEAYRICLFMHLHSSVCTCKSNHHATALCDRRGVIYQSEHGFSRLLRREWPSWAGPLLPDQIVRLVQDGINTAEGKQVDICIEPLNDIYQIQLCLHSPLRVLAPREQMVAELLSEGLPYKEIAQRLEISPSTVTNQANAIYRKLKIGGREELCRLLQVRGGNGSNDP